MKVIVNRGSDILTTVESEESSQYSAAMMGENKVTLNFTLNKYFEFVIGDYIALNGRPYYMNNAAVVDKLSSNVFQYSIVFEGIEYVLNNKILMDEGQSDFDYYGTPEEYIQLLVDNINSISSGWSIGDIEDADPIGISFSDTNVRSALTQIAEEFNFEYQIKDKVINLGKVIGQTGNFSLKYGMNNGLYSLIRRPLNDQGLITRLYAFGSSDNLPANYLPNVKNPRLVFPAKYLERNTDIFGIRESVITFDEIKPERTGTVSSVSATDNNVVIDSSLDFNLNDVIIQGQAAIIFITGNLQGQQFSIASYNDATKQVSFNRKQEENGYVLPNDTIKPAIGDKYKFTGITMPQSYINAAEARLLQKATEYFNEHVGSLKVIYDLNDDELFLKQNPDIYEFFQIGNFIPIEDPDLGDATLRIQSLSFPINAPYRVSATISDEVIYTRGEQVLKEIKSQKDKITVIETTTRSNGRIQSILREELRETIFDPDGYFDTENIRPQSIETQMLTVGARGQNLSLDLIITPNYEEDENTVAWSSGPLDHFTVDPNSVKRWDISEGSIDGLNPALPYYIYAKCNKLDGTGTLAITINKIKTEGDSLNYYFLIGVLSSVVEGVRWISLTYGITSIDGGFITTGTISADRLNVQEIVVSGGGATVEQLTQAEQDAIQAAKYYADGRFNNLGELAYADLVEIAKLGTTIIQGGYIKTDLIDVDQIFAEDITATNLKVTGNSKIGDWSINSGIYSGNAPFQPNSQFSSFTPGALVMRRNGVNPASPTALDDMIEIIFGYLGLGTEVGARIVNNISSLGQTNTALAIGAKNGGRNVALDVFYGEARLKGVCVGVQNITEANTLINNNTEFAIINSLNGGTGNPNVFMPATAYIGRKITVKNNSGGGASLQANANNGNIIAINGNPSNPALMLNNHVRTYIFDGANWIEINTH